MNRRGFLRAVGATGLLLCTQGPARGAGVGAAPAEELIRRALAGRYRLQFRYHGHERKVEPHALGRVTAGRRALLGWQVSGGSQSEPPPGWRTFLLGEIEALRVLEERFTLRGDYHPESAKLKPIEAEVEPGGG